MGRKTRVLAVVLLLLAVAAPARGSERLGLAESGATASEGDESVSISAEVGVGGFVARDGANAAVVTIAADSLVAGSLRMEVGSAVVVLPVEVPAGTTKVFVVDLPSLTGGQQARLQVVDDDGTVRADQRITIRVPRDELVVGVFGDAALAAAIGELTTTPFAIELAPVELDEAAFGRPLSALSFLVLAQLPENDVSTEIRRWVESGGRLIAASDTVEALGLGDVPAPSTGAGQLGDGTISIRDLSDLAGAFPSLKPQSTSGGNQFNEFDGNQGSLFEAATAGGNVGALSLPWLIGALIIYVVVAGPVNFLVLARIGRRDWAWLTVPAISVVAMASFWAIGRTSAEDQRTQHATVVVQSDTGSAAETGVVLVASTDGEHTLGFGSEVFARTFDAANWFGGVGRTVSEIRPGVDGGVELSYELASFGLGAARSSWRPEALDIDITVTDEQVIINNQSGYEFVDWGIRLNDDIEVERSLLADDAEVTFDTSRFQRPAGNHFTDGPIADAVFGRGFDGGFDELRGQTVWPLSSTATVIDRDLLLEGSYFFGFTDGFTVALDVDGRAREVTGRSLVVVEIDRGAAAGVETMASPQLVEAIGAEFIEEYGPTFVYGADSLGLRYGVPTGVTGPLEIRQQGFGGTRGVESVAVYNWTTGAFDESSFGAQLDPDAYVSPDGDVMVQLTMDELDAEVLIDEVTLTWSNS